MKRRARIALGILGSFLGGFFIVGSVSYFTDDSSNFSDTSSAKTTEPSDQAAKSHIRDDLFGPPAPKLPDSLIAAMKPPPLPPEREKDGDGYYEIDLPAGLGSDQMFHRMSRDIRKLLIDTKDDVEVGWPIRAAVYFKWPSGAKDEIVQLVFAPSTVKTLLNTPSWLKGSAVENIPDLVEDKVIVNAAGFARLCNLFFLNRTSRQVAGERFCLY